MYLLELTHCISLTPNINTFQKSQNHWWWGNDLLSFSVCKMPQKGQERSVFWYI